MIISVEVPGHSAACVEPLRRLQSLYGFHEEAPDEYLAGRLDAERRRGQLVALLERLAPPERQLMLLYLEGLDAGAISEVTGLSSANVATKVHRIKRILAAHVRGARAPSSPTGAAHGN